MSEPADRSTHVSSPGHQSESSAAVALWQAAMDTAACVRTETHVQTRGPVSHTWAYIGDGGRALRIDQRYAVEVFEAGAGASTFTDEQVSMIQLEGQTWVSEPVQVAAEEELSWVRVVDHDVDEDSLPEQPDPEDDEAWEAWDAIVTAAYNQGPGHYRTLTVQMAEVADPWRLLRVLSAFPAYAGSPGAHGTTVWTSRTDQTLPAALSVLLGSTRPGAVQQHARVVTDPSGLPVEIEVRLIADAGAAPDRWLVMTLSQWGARPEIEAPDPARTRSTADPGFWT